MFKRELDGVLPQKTFFLFGPRQVGKSTLLKGMNLTRNIDLLNTELQLQYTKNPQLLRQELDALPKGKTRILIDEIQRVPKLLDVIHAAMEEHPEWQFILCGSSARKLRHGAANLLGGRALYRQLHPLTLSELNGQLKLDWILSYGSLPKIYSVLLEGNTMEAQDLLRAYLITYLKEEIKAEALVRNLQGFQNFLDVAAAQYAEQINFSGISRDCQVALSTVKEFYSILEDTLIGFFLQPLYRSERKRMSHQPKFYFFDNGVTRSILETLQDSPAPNEKGRLFEQWIVQEVVRFNDYQQKDWKLFFWRTSHGAEVDLIIGRGKKILCAIECKLTKNPSSSDLSGLRAFEDSHPKTPLLLVAPVERPLKIQNIPVIPPQQLLKELKNL